MMKMKKKKTQRERKVLKKVKEKKKQRKNRRIQEPHVRFFQSTTGKQFYILGVHGVK